MSARDYYAQVREKDVKDIKFTASNLHKQGRIDSLVYKAVCRALDDEKWCPQAVGFAMYDQALVKRKSAEPMFWATLANQQDRVINWANNLARRTNEGTAE